VSVEFKGVRAPARPLTSQKKCNGTYPIASWLAAGQLVQIEEDRRKIDIMEELIFAIICEILESKFVEYELAVSHLVKRTNLPNHNL